MLEQKWEVEAEDLLPVRGRKMREDDGSPLERVSAGCSTMAVRLSRKKDLKEKLALNGVLFHLITCLQ